MEKNLAQNLKFLRKYHKYNLTEIGALFQVSKSAISDYENGHSTPSFHLVQMYCKTFDVSLSLINKIIFDERSFSNGSYKDLQATPIVSTEQYKDLKLKYNLLKQKTEGLEIQTNLMSQLLESRESENKTLKLQIELLLLRNV